MKATASSPVRLAVVLSHPTQYYSPWFRWMAANTALSLRVFYLWEFGVKATFDPRFEKTFTWDVDLLSGYEFEFLPNCARQPGAESFWGFNNPQLTKRLQAWKPEAILLFGYAWASHLRTILWARLHRVPIIFRGDSHLLGREKLSSKQSIPLKFLFRQFAAVTFVGQANRHYFEQLGVPRKKVFFAPHAVDQDLFNSALPIYRTEAAELRRSLGIEATTRVVLFAGKFVPAKQPFELLQAFIAVRIPHTALIFVGDGPELSRLKALANSSRVSRVFFLPFANQSKMPAHYLLGDVFCLPSRGNYETWGLAVNEAMHMGSPCLVSDRVGCQQNLVTDENTGWVFRSDDATHLREKLSAALTANLSPFKIRVAERINGYTYEAATAGLLAAVASVVQK